MLQCDTQRHGRLRYHFANFSHFSSFLFLIFRHYALLCLGDSSLLSYLLLFLSQSQLAVLTVSLDHLLQLARNFDVRFLPSWHTITSRKESSPKKSHDH